MLTISQKGIDLIKEFEGLHDGNKKTATIEPMLDPIGIPTIGWGSTTYEDGRRVKMGDPGITLEQAESLLVHHLQVAEATVRSLVKVPLNQNQFDALVSFVYNLGAGNFGSSTLLKKINSGCFSCAAKEFGRWNRAGGKVLNGLTKRREKERSLFMS